MRLLLYAIKHCFGRKNKPIPKFKCFPYSPLGKHVCAPINVTSFWKKGGGGGWSKRLAKFSRQASNPQLIDALSQCVVCVLRSDFPQPPKKLLWNTFEFALGTLGKKTCAHGISALL